MSLYFSKITKRWHAKHLIDNYQPPFEAEKQNFDVYLDRIQSSFKGVLLTVKDPSASNRLVFSIKDVPHALHALAGVRRPQGFSELAWKEIAPSMARVFLASRELARSKGTDTSAAEVLV